MDKGLLARQEFDTLFDALCQAGYQVIGPKAKDGAILFEPLDSFAQLPYGLEEETSPGHYRLAQKQHQRAFAWTLGPQSLKPWLFKSEQTLWYAEEDEQGFRFSQSPPAPTPLAFIGLRACDLAALSLLDKHFWHCQYPDPWYQAQRKQLCLIAVNCSRSADTCFCTSTTDGPEVTYGFDLLLDELDDGYLLQAKSDKGADVIKGLSLHKANDKHLVQAKQQLENAAKQKRRIPSPEQLYLLSKHLDDSRWQEIAQRCLACGNCTSVCPTCYCSKQQSETDTATGLHKQVRYWDSCFTQGHSWIAGKQIRSEISQRYRQWLLHKLATWQDQYGRTGCVGCGRCIGWCPVGIDMVEEANALLAGNEHD